jgi:BlaI family penicillinase repressor
MKKMPRISETEWEVMKVAWKLAPCSAGRIIEALHQRDPAWHPKTVKALGFEVDGRAYLYHPLVRQSECAEAASVSFLERVFGGSFQPMLAHFVARKKLSREEIKELKKLLDSQE